MKLVIFLFLILGAFLVSSLHFVSSQEISLNYPNEVCVDEEFNVQLTLINFSSGVYDVKMDILDASSGERISKIYNGLSWQSTFNYINDIISNDESKSFSLIIFKDFNTATITVKIKSSSGVIKNFTGYNISKKSSCSPENPSDNSTTGNNTTNDNSNYTSVENFTKSSDESISNSKNSTSTQNLENSYNPLNNQKVDLAPISLNAKTIKTEKSSDFENKTKGKYAIYLLITFCVLLLFLFLLKKKKYNKNEFS